MDKKWLFKKLIEKGIAPCAANKLLKSYKEIPSFSYSALLLSQQKDKYSKQFGKAYSGYGIYIFYLKDPFEIKYIGEAASEPFSKRLSQHFNNSHGGLPKKKPGSTQILDLCDVLILYGKNGKKKARETHFDEDLLIGVFRPQLNDR